MKGCIHAPRSSRFLREADGLSLAPAAVDEHPLGGADEAAVQALGACAPVLSLFAHDFATLAPDLVHEARLTVAGNG